MEVLENYFTQLDFVNDSKTNLHENDVKFIYTIHFQRLKISFLWLEDG
jgi:hypothetical protein